MFEIKRYELLLRAEEPIAHHSESFGNSAVFMRQKTRMPDGTFVHVPHVTGDTMRHGLREAVAYALLDAAGLLDSPSLSEAALRLLFAGGMITGNGDGSTIKLDEYRKMIDLLPSLALLGGCAGNRTIPGKLTCGSLVLVCEETLHLLPEWVHQYAATEKIAIDTQRAHVEEVQRVRMDPSLVPAKRALLTEGERGRIEGRLLKSEAASEEGDHAGKDDAKSTMMPRRFETLVAGSLFFWRVSATCHSQLDVDTFHVMIAALMNNCRVGGKKGTGHGLLKPVAGCNVAVARPAEATTSIDVASLAPRLGEMFRAHVKERASQVADLLRTVDA